MIDTHVHHWNSADSGTHGWTMRPSTIYARITSRPTIALMLRRCRSTDGFTYKQRSTTSLTQSRRPRGVESLAEEASAAGLPGPLACVVYADLRAANVRDLCRVTAGTR